MNVRIPLLYALIAGTWIVFSDQLLATIFPEFESFKAFQTYKGWGFVAVSALFLYIILTHELGKRQKTEDDLKTALGKHRELAQIVARSPAVAFLWRAEPGWPVEFVSENVSIFGYTPGEFTGGALSYAEIVHPDDLPRVADEVEHHTNSGKTEFIQEYRILDESGHAHWLHDHTWIRQDSHGVVSHYQGIVFDVSERKSIQENLQRANERLGAIVNASPLPIFILDPEGIVNFWNPAAERVFGWQEDEVLGQQLPIVAPEKRAQFDTLRRRVLMGESFSGEEAQRQRRDGSKIDISISTAPLRDSQGGIIGIMAIVEDITARKQAEAALQNYTNRLEVLNKIDQAILAAHSLKDIAVAAIAGLHKSVPYARASVVVFDMESETGKIVAARGEEHPIIAAGNSFALGSMTAIEDLLQGNPVILQLDQISPGSSLEQALNAAGIRSVMRLPMIARGNLIGSLNLASLSDQAFTLEQVEITQEVSNVLAIALQQAQMNEQLEQHARDLEDLYDTTQRQLRQLASLRIIDKAITASSDLSTTLMIFLEQVVQRLQVDAADVLLFDPQTQVLDYAAGKGFRTRAVERASIRLGQAYAGQVALKHRLIHISGITTGTPSASPPEMFADVLLKEGFDEYYGVPLIAKGEVNGVLEVFHRTTVKRNREWWGFLEALADQAAIAIDNIRLFEQLQRSNQELQVSYDSTLVGWSRALELRDQETRGHSERVTDMTLRLAAAMGMPQRELGDVRRGALLHDIGKMGLPDHILFKPGPLTKDEWEIMRHHPVWSYQLLASIPYLNNALDIPYCHHERWDGSGYPRGLIGDQIPLAARIFAVVDVYDALCSRRPYREAWSPQRAITYISDQAGVEFDPDVVQVFVEQIDKIARQQHNTA